MTPRSRRPSRHPDLRIESFGDASAGAELNTCVENDLKRAGMMSIPITLIILLIAFASMVAARVSVVLLALSAIATTWAVSIPSHVFPIDDLAAIRSPLIGLAVGVDYSLFYMRREREGVPTAARPQRIVIAVGNVRPHPGLGLTVMWRWPAVLDR